MKPVTRSAPLTALPGDKAMPTPETSKKIWDYIKRNKLQDTRNQRTVLPATVAPRSLTKAQIELMVKSSLTKSLT